jgi:hypothetical protein
MSVPTGIHCGRHKPDQFSGVGVNRTSWKEFLGENKKCYRIDAVAGKRFGWEIDESSTGEEKSQKQAL